MYWLKSRFDIASIKDIEFLIALYKNVPGELTVYDVNNNKVLEVKWQNNPFNELVNCVNYVMPFYIHSRLVGPDTIKAVSILVEKLDSLEHDNLSAIKQWKTYIDEIIFEEMNRENDRCWMFEPPTSKLNMAELWLAIKYSKYVTHAIPTQTGFIISNTKSVYLSFVSTNDGGSFYLQFDKDDGFNSPFGTNTTIDYLNTKFVAWKNDNYSNNIQDYYDQY
jgi:hypothetical protein